MPRDYMPTEEIMKRIKVIAEAGLDYFWTDLTKGQRTDLELLGYEIEESYNNFKISWRK